MKKKIKDLSKKECRKICKNSYCEYCVLENTEKCIHFNEQMNREVEVNE